jgi:succinate dehydrogenase / fumarate reductase flavoprotein subunit
MQCAGDGYFIIPHTIGNYLAGEIKTPGIQVNTPEFEKSEKEARTKLQNLLSVNGSQTVTSFHKRLGKIMWDYCGMTRNEEGLNKALLLIDELKVEFWKDVKVPGTADELNQELEKAFRVADFFELAKLMVLDALNRKESCGAHFREESQTDTGEAKRDDENFSYVSAWEYKGDDQPPQLHKEELKFENVELKVRDYK